MKNPHNTLLKSSRTLPQSYNIQTKESWKKHLEEAFDIRITSNKRSFLLGLELKHGDSPENFIKEELLMALEATKIRTIVIGENPFAKPYKYIHFLPASSKSRALKACDVFLFPSYEDAFTCMHSGTVCMMYDDHIVSHYQAQKESGNGFVCDAKNHWQVFAEIIRAEEHFSFHYDWKHLCQNAMDRCFEG